MCGVPEQDAIHAAKTSAISVSSLREWKGMFVFQQGFILAPIVNFGIWPDMSPRLPNVGRLVAFRVVA
jgi:hypothetical protein